jgi:hypothetical protein
VGGDHPSGASDQFLGGLGPEAAEVGAFGHDSPQSGYQAAEGKGYLERVSVHHDHGGVREGFEQVVEPG